MGTGALRRRPGEPPFGGRYLTGAGYLPPAHVHAAFTELGYDTWLIGADNREDQTYPILQLRESAQRPGRVVAVSGRAAATVAGPRSPARWSRPLEPGPTR